MTKATQQQQQNHKVPFSTRTKKETEWEDNVDGGVPTCWHVPACSSIPEGPKKEAAPSMVPWAGCDRPHACQPGQRPVRPGWTRTQVLDASLPLLKGVKLPPRQQRKGSCSPLVPIVSVHVHSASPVPELSPGAHVLPKPTGSPSRSISHLTAVLKPPRREGQAVQPAPPYT